MSIARTIFMLACVAGTDACLAGEQTFPVQGQGAYFLQPPVLVTDAPADSSAAAAGGPVTPLEAASGIGIAVDPALLQELRGGQSLVDNDVLIDGTVDNNIAEDVVTGSNAINGDAFANTSGISTVIQNTGNNVLIQNGMVVNVQFVGP